MSQNEIDILKRAIKREKAARKAAEKILEDKSRELFITSEELKTTNLKLEQLLDEKSTQLQGVFENIIDAYVVMDLRGNIIKFNEPAIHLFGYDMDKESINVMKLIYKEDYKYAMKSFKKLTKKGFFTNYRARVITKDKAVKWVHINASLIYNKEKKPIAAQGIVRDITDLKNLELQKETLLNKLEKSNEELQEYAHIVSHDLKSPLRSIDALVSWIKEDNKDHLDAASLQNFKLIETTLEKMEDLISSILTYSSIDFDSVKKETVDLNLILEDLNKTLIVPKHITIKVKTKLPKVKGFKTKLEQLFQNLIGNAIKFMDKEKGLIEINVKENPSYYEFSIKDNGIGIDKKYHEKIFKIFNSLNKRKDSTGIGLSIVKKIIDLHNGEIWLDSVVGEFTTFYFTLKK